MKWLCPKYQDTTLIFFIFTVVHMLAKEVDDEPLDPLSVVTVALSVLSVDSNVVKRARALLKSVDAAFSSM